MNEAITFSIVVPLYNEEASVTPLYVRLTQVMTGLDEPYEIVFVDDGSTDQTLKALYEVYESDSRVSIVTLLRNFGQTPALKAGFDAARGEVIISMDGDLQHDPAEIPSFIQKLDEGFDIVSGWRYERKDTLLTRRLPSRIANWTMAKLSGVPLHDFDTTFKAYRREIIQDLLLHGELHRFIPALAASSGARITEIAITNPPRQHGKSNYGLSRIFRVFLDLLSIKFWLDYSTKPMHFFGFFGLAATGAGIFTGSLLLFQNVMAHAEFASNVTLTIATITLLLAGAQILCVGFASEILSRTYYESQKKHIYVSRATRDSNEEDLKVGREVEDAIYADDGNHFENHVNPSPLPAQTRPERPLRMLSAHQPRLVRRIAG